MAAAGSAAWLAGTGLVYRRAFGRFPSTSRDLFFLTPADFQLPSERAPVRTSDGVKLLSWFLPGERQAVVVVSGGYRGHVRDVLGIAGALWRSGFSVAVYAWRGTPGSGRAPHTLGCHERRDLAAVLDRVVDRFGEVPIGLLGCSLGGAVSLWVASADPRVRAVCTDSAFADPRRLLADAVRRHVPLPPSLTVGPAVWAMELRTGARLSQFVPEEVVPRIAPRPLLIIHGDRDQLVPVGHAHRLHAAAGEPKQLWVVPGVDHVSAFLTHRDEYLRRVVEFFDAALASGHPGLQEPLGL